MAELSYIVATAGHVDHGKSTLVEALSGINPDRLPEEQKRGMTIELGFAQLTFKDPSETSTVFQLGLVDVPGHADFVRNMVAGVGSIDLAMLVVACDDGWMPQTEEHLQILLYLGAKRAVVALTKSDTAQDLPASVAAIREQLADTALADAPIIPVCALSGEGLDDLKAALAGVLRQTPPQADHGKPWLAVDRVFSPRGTGTVVTGTLLGGQLKVGTELLVQPRALPTRVRGLQRHSHALETALPGTRTAVQLHDVAVQSDQHPDGIRRGDVLTLASMGAAQRLIHVKLDRSTRDPEAPALRTGQKVWLHLGAASYEARVNLAGSRTLAPGESALAELRLAKPALACCGDRLVLRHLSKQHTLAGGLVLDPSPRFGRFRKPTQQTMLAARSAAPHDLLTWASTQLERDQALAPGQLLAQSHYSSAEIASTIPQLRDAWQTGPWLIHRPWWSGLLQLVAALITDYHVKQPQALGLKLSDLRAQTEKLLPDGKLFDLLLTELGALGYTRNAGLIRSSKHLAKLPPELNAAGDKLRKALAQNPIEPPNPKELAPTPTDQKALKFLIETGEAVFLDEKAVLLASAYEGLKSKIATILREQGKATVAEIREVLGTTRRILVPLLEKLDKENFTRREGDYRRLR
jgi:selenocysteine-specific elongation factor